MRNNENGTRKCIRCGKEQARFSVWMFDTDYDLDKTMGKGIWIGGEFVLPQPIYDYPLCNECHGQFVDWLWKGGAVQKFSDSLWEDCK